MIKSKAKAIVLLSGGLDSMLAAKILLRQKITVLALSFRSYFFDAKLAKKAARLLRIKLKIVDISDEQLEIVKHPRHGWGKAINPCIDCHTLMLKKAKEVMKKENYDFVATGEVLGERPMSQNKKAMEIVESESGLKGYLLRPLSAKLLPKTLPEKKNLVQRERLFAISGRSRKIQMELAKKWGIKSFPTPAGGCILTDKEFAKRLREMIKRNPKCEGKDIQLLRHGRIFWYYKTIIVVSRNEKEEKILRNLAKSGDVLIELKDYPGPLILIRSFSGHISNAVILKSKRLLKQYAKKAPQDKSLRFLVQRYA